MRKILVNLLVGMSLLVSSSVYAGFSPAGFSILNPAQFPPTDIAIVGARVSLLWGKNRAMYGVDVGGIGNTTELDFTGIGVSGIFNSTHGTTTILGLQLAGITNINAQKANIYGIQLAGGLNVNLGEGSIVGLEAGILGNHSPFAKIYGIQVGLYNKSREVYGFQIGLFNATESLHGIQIGLVNYNATGLFAVAPLVNIGF